MIIKEILQKSIKNIAAKKIESSSLDAELLLLYALSRSKNKPELFRLDRSWLIAHNDYSLTKQEEKLFLKLIKRRAKFEPVAYITGKKEFYGIEFDVDKNVLIPRPETEIMVEESLKDILARSVIGEKAVIADIGTGSGVIAISIANALKEKNIIKNYKIFAVDISSAALKIAKKNAKKHNLDKDIIFRKGNLIKALPKNTKVDYLLANLPYGDKDCLYKRLGDSKKLSYFFGLKYEPKISIFAESNGMSYFNIFFKNVSSYLADNASIFLESDPHQISAIIKLAKKYLPAHKTEVWKDLRGLDRITGIKIL